MLKSMYFDACRLCLKMSNQSMINIFVENQQIPVLLERFIQLKIIKDEYIESYLPQQICVLCNKKILQIVDFKELCLRSDIFLKKQIGSLKNDKESSIKSISTTKPDLVSLAISNDENRQLTDNNIKKENITKKPLQKNKNSGFKKNTKHKVKQLKHKIRTSSSGNKILGNKNTIKLLLSVKEENQNAEIEQVNESFDEHSIINIEDIKKEKNIPTEKYNLQTKSDITKSNKGQITCDICGKFLESWKLKYHMNMHNGIRPFRCTFEKCTSTFTSPFDLSKHNKRCHIIGLSYTCEICGKSFKFLTTFKYHKTYHGEPKIPCEICGKLLRNDRVVKKHMMVHTGERPFPCDLCTKSFQNRYNLRVHKRIHTKERPFVCGFCDESFGYNSLLKAHTEKIHHILKN